MHLAVVYLALWSASLFFVTDVVISILAIPYKETNASPHAQTIDIQYPNLLPVDTSITSILLIAFTEYKIKSSSITIPTP